MLPAPILCQDPRVRPRVSLDLSLDHSRPSPARRVGAPAIGSGTVPERVMAAELGHRSQPSEALSMMVSSMVRMVQAGKGQAAGSRWSAS
ncbi:hypothetical protein BBFGKLBO_01557 [Synechococcus sp. CBW1107]|nr:hypothetical protein BBFGKLBO_01557 [Synechococcus sp. CBW1107]